MKRIYGTRRGYAIWVHRDMALIATNIRGDCCRFYTVSFTTYDATIITWAWADHGKWPGRSFLAMSEAYEAGALKGTPFENIWKAGWKWEAKEVAQWPNLTEPQFTVLKHSPVERLQWAMNMGFD